jgi:elongation factor P
VTISINEIKSGLTIQLDGQIYTVLEYQHVKPGKGSAFVRTKLRNLKNGGTLEKTFKGNEKIQEAFIEEKRMQYLYRSGKLYHFMDQETYEDVEISEDILGPNSKFLKDNLQIIAYSYDGEIFNIELPTFIELKVVHTEPGVKGDTAKAAMKLATVQTGANITVPLFIKQGDVIKVDTRSGGYVERVG